MKVLRRTRDGIVCRSLVSAGGERRPVYKVKVFIVQMSDSKCQGLWVDFHFLNGGFGCLGPLPHRINPPANREKLSRWVVQV